MWSQIMQIKQIYCISLNMLDRLQSQALEINRYSIFISLSHHDPPVQHVASSRATLAVGGSAA